MVKYQRIVLTKIWWNVQPIVVCPIVEALVCFPEFGGFVKRHVGVGGYILGGPGSSWS